MKNEHEERAKTLLALSVMKGIAYAENGGKPDVNNPTAGKSGEMKSIFQYEPATWKKVAAKYLGNANAPMNADSEATATLKRIHEWVEKDYSIPQMASMWNAGEGEPDAYTGKFSDGSPSIGTNKKYGVKFNVPAYTKLVQGYTEKFLRDGMQQMQQTKQENPVSSPVANSQPAPVAPDAPKPLAPLSFAEQPVQNQPSQGIA